MPNDHSAARPETRAAAARRSCGWFALSGRHSWPRSPAASICSLTTVSD